MDAMSPRGKDVNKTDLSLKINTSLIGDEHNSSVIRKKLENRLHHQGHEEKLNLNSEENGVEEKVEEMF